jgi:predicted DNA-binding antitoxin AbrB/MazE fold protein
MKHQSIPVIYEDGILKPLVPLDLVDRQTLYITIEAQPHTTADTTLEAWQAVYAELDEDTLSEIESIALSRDNFMNQSPPDP